MSVSEDEAAGTGWLTFSASMLGLAGILAVIDGIAAAAGRGGSNEAPPEEYEAEPAPAPEDPVEEFQTLAKLHASGALTDDEFADAKAKILAVARQ